jgi:hypothetical protein
LGVKLLPSDWLKTSSRQKELERQSFLDRKTEQIQALNKPGYSPLLDLVFAKSKAGVIEAQVAKSALMNAMAPILRC